jgi:hypothetical protein
MRGSVCGEVISTWAQPGGAASVNRNYHPGYALRPEGWFDPVLLEEADVPRDREGYVHISPDLSAAKMLTARVRTASGREGVGKAAFHERDSSQKLETIH